MIWVRPAGATPLDNLNTDARLQVPRCKFHCFCLEHLRNPYGEGSTLLRLCHEGLIQDRSSARSLQLLFFSEQDVDLFELLASRVCSGTKFWLGPAVVLAFVSPACRAMAKLAFDPISGFKTHYGDVLISTTAMLLALKSKLCPRDA